MPVRRYSDVFQSSRLPYPERPRMPMPEQRNAGFFDFLSAGAKGVNDTLGAYQNSVMDRLKREEAEASFAEDKRIREGRAAFRNDIRNGITEEIKGPNEFGAPDRLNQENPFYGAGDTSTRQRRELTDAEVAKSAFKNLDPDEARYWNDKNKPASMKMKEVTDAYDVEFKKRIEDYKAQNEGKYPTRDIQEQMALEIGGTPYAKLVKQSTSMETTFDNRKQKGIEEQRIAGNKLAEERLAQTKASYELAVGKDFRSDQQEYGKKLIDLQAVETHLKPVEDKINSGQVDMLSSKVFSNNWGQIAQNLAGEDPELSSELGYLAAAYIKMISGAAVNEGEAIRLLGTVGVNVWSTKEKMKAGIQGMRNELNAKQNILDNSYDRVRDHYRGKGQKPASPAVEPSPNVAPDAAPKKETPAERMKRLGL